MKTLVTKRLILRELKPDDLIDFYSYCKKQTIGPNAGWRPHESIEESARILRLMINEGEVFGIEHKKNHKLIGTIGLHVRNFDNAILNQKELGYVLDDTYWGQGLMVEAVNKVLEYAFNILELDKVICGHFVNNMQSKSVILKTNFKFTHQEKRDFYDQSEVLVMMYELTKNDYLKENMNGN
jgi:[ribosomal protein S5]-alanine N-acetyltransferase